MFRKGVYMATTQANTQAKAKALADQDQKIAAWLEFAQAGEGRTNQLINKTVAGMAKVAQCRNTGKMIDAIADCKLENLPTELALMQQRDKKAIDKSLVEGRITEATAKARREKLDDDYAAAIEASKTVSFERFAEGCRWIAANCNTISVKIVSGKGEFPGPASSFITDETRTLGTELRKMFSCSVSKGEFLAYLRAGYVRFGK